MGHFMHKWGWLYTIYASKHVHKVYIQLYITMMMMTLCLFCLHREQPVWGDTGKIQQELLKEDSAGRLQPHTETMWRRNCLIVNTQASHLSIYLSLSLWIVEGQLTLKLQLSGWTSINCFSYSSYSFMLSLSTKFSSAFWVRYLTTTL